MADPLFSIIVPTYRRPRYLREALDSALAQTERDLEVVVVDDASPEPLGALPEDPRIRLVRRDANGGSAAARNTGIEHARGRFVAFLDDDDVYLPTRLAMAREGLERAPVSICWAHYLDVEPSPGRVLEGNVYDVILDGMAPHLGRTAVRRDTIPRFDERFEASAELEWWLRLAKETPVATVPQVGYLVRRHAGPRHRNDTAARIRCRFRLMRMYPEYFSSHPRAEAFAWKRIGLMARALGDRRLARRAFRHSLRRAPEARTLWHLARSFGPSSGAVEGDDLAAPPARRPAASETPT